MIAGSALDSPSMIWLVLAALRCMPTVQCFPARGNMIGTIVIWTIAV
jgi:hypothetical protein